MLLVGPPTDSPLATQARAQVESAAVPPVHRLATRHPARERAGAEEEEEEEAEAEAKVTVTDKEAMVG